MFSHVFGVSDHLEVLDSVVVLLAVFVMDKLTGLQLAAEVLLHDPAVLEATFASAVAHFDVAIGVLALAPDCLLVATLAAEDASLRHLAGRALERVFADFAGEDCHLVIVPRVGRRDG